METTRNRRIRRALALVVGVAVVALPIFSAPSSAAAPSSPSGTISDTVDLTSLPADATLSLPKIDPTAVDVFALTKVTITATLASSLTGDVTNLSNTKSKTIRIGANVGMSMDGDALGAPLELNSAYSETLVIPPGGTVPFDFADSDESVEVVEEAGALATLLGLLVGETGTIDFPVSGVVDAFVNGPAPYVTTGVASGQASVTIDYEYVETCPHDAQLPADDPNCAPPPPPPPPECVDWDLKIDPVVVGDYAIPGGGTFTITKVDNDASTFDWSSTEPVSAILVKGGPQAIPREEFVYDPPATSGTGLHAPLNPHSGKWYGLSHITICFAPDPEASAETVAPQTAESNSEETKNQGGQKPDTSEQEPKGPPETSGQSETNQSEPEQKPPEPQPAPEPDPEPQATESKPAAEEPQTARPPADDGGDDTEKPTEPEGAGGQGGDGAAVSEEEEGQ